MIATQGGQSKPRDTPSFDDCQGCGKSRSLSTVAVIEDGKRKRLRLCDKCIEEYTDHTPNLQPSGDVVSDIFGENYSDRSFENFYVSEGLFTKYNRLLRDHSDFSEKIVQNQAYRKSDIQGLKRAKSEMVTVTEDLAPSGCRIVVKAPPGAGKTHLLCGAVRRLVEGGMQVSGISALEFTGRITDTYSQRKASEEQTKQSIIRELTQADVVVIDDLGKSTITSGTRRNLTWLLKETLRRCSTLMVGTTLGVKQLASSKEGVGPEAYDTLRESPSRWVEWDVPSFRRTKSRLQQYLG